MDPAVGRHYPLLAVALSVASCEGTVGGRPPAFDPQRYEARNVVQGCLNRLKQSRALATRDTEPAAYPRRSFCRPVSSSGSARMLRRAGPWYCNGPC